MSTKHPLEQFGFSYYASTGEYEFGKILDFYDCKITFLQSHARDRREITLELLWVEKYKHQQDDAKTGKRRVNLTQTHPHEFMLVTDITKQVLFLPEYLLYGLSQNEQHRVSTILFPITYHL